MVQIELILSETLISTLLESIPFLAQMGLNDNNFVGYFWGLPPSIGTQSLYPSPYQAMSWQR